MTQEWRQNVIVHRSEADGKMLGVAESVVAHEVLNKALESGCREVHVVLKEPTAMPIKPGLEGARRHLEVWAFAYAEDGK